MNDELESLAEKFSYLDNLRESGSVNMFGSAPYLAETFGMSITEAQKVFSKWSQTFTKDKTAEERAKLALDRSES